MTGHQAIRPSGHQAISGVLVVDKPEGPTSHDVVTLTRRALGVSRIGHTGTLDPLATGVLPLVIGRATRLAQFLAAVQEKKPPIVTARAGRAALEWAIEIDRVMKPAHESPRVRAQA